MGEGGLGGVQGQGPGKLSDRIKFFENFQKGTQETKVSADKRADSLSNILIPKKTATTPTIIVVTPEAKSHLMEAHTQDGAIKEGFKNTAQSAVRSTRAPRSVETLKMSMEKIDKKISEKLAERETLEQDKLEEEQIIQESTNLLNKARQELREIRQIRSARPDQIGDAELKVKEQVSNIEYAKYRLFGDKDDPDGIMPDLKAVDKALKKLETKKAELQAKIDQRS